MALIKNLLLATTILTSSTSLAAALAPEQVLQKVIDHYPSIDIAAIEIERARQSIKVAESQLGWQLQAQAGIERGVGLFGTAADRLSVGAGASRMLESGSSLSIDGGINREDNATVLSPAMPNPATTSKFGISYRQPLSQNTAQRTFEELKTTAKLDLDLARAESEETYDQLASKVIEIYFAVAVLQAGIENVQDSISRSRRLQKYIKEKASLGISEEKDILQVDAQLNALLAEKEKMEISRTQQQVALNRLMGRSWDTDIAVKYTASELTGDFSSLYASAKKYSPRIKLLEARLAQTDSAIRSRRELKEDALDLVLFAGGQNYRGDTAVGSASDTELTGGLRLEYKENMDKSGVDAELYQAQLERSKVLYDRNLLLEDLTYKLAGLLAEIKANNQSISAYEKSVSSEKQKVDEAMKRYRSGRIDTDVLIKFEDQLSLASYSLELQRIALVQRNYQLQIILGTLWETIKKPEYQDYLKEPVGASY